MKTEIKQKKQLLCIVFALIMCMAAFTNVFAATEVPRLTDGAKLLSDDKQGELLGLLDEISQKQQTDVVIVTTSTLGGKTPEEYADDFYDDNGFGCGDEKSGVLLLISTEDSDWWISACGYAMTAITDDGIKYISDQFLPHLKDGDYAAAFLCYANLCDEFITQAKSGKPYDGSHMPKKAFNTLVCLLTAAAVGVGIALCVTGVMKAQLKSVKMQSAAENYVKAGSLNINESRDMFLYNTIERKEKPKSDGGSSAHRSSSGRTHSGGGGKF